MILWRNIYDKIPYCTNALYDRDKIKEEVATAIEGKYSLEEKNHIFGSIPLSAYQHMFLIIIRYNWELSTVW